MAIEQLRDEILSKKPVIHTRFAEQLITEPHDVESSYLQHYHTHVSLGDTDAFTQRLIKRVSASQTTRGAVVAPWGYGKTSTMIFAWKQCEQAKLVAIPPFIFSSLQDVLSACYGWLKFRLGDTYHAELQEAYDRYAGSAFEDRVRSYVSQTGVSEADARSVLQRAMEDGSFTPELTVSNLMEFLRYSTEVVIRAGFKGLVVLADELQQFVDKSSDLRGTIQKLREIMLWLATHSDLPLGVILCLPSGTESGLQEGGTDVLDRLKTDGLYISLRNIYDPDFPQLLWDRYIEHYDVDTETDNIIDRYALKSLGQIAAREDLGRGPRTVIDVFQCAFRHYSKTGQTYTAIALIDDFLSNQISYTDRSNEIRFAVEDALALFKSRAITEAHQHAVKLWAAFPEHGCPNEVLEFYGARGAADELSEIHGVHGPLLTYQSVGYTLRKLATYTPGGSAVERMARDFWLVYKEQDPQWLEAARDAFIEYVLPRIFEIRRGAWDRWELRLTPTGSYSGCLIGTFSEDYPKRYVEIWVASDPKRIEQWSPEKENSDFRFDFLLRASRSPEADSDPGSIEFLNENPRWVRLELNLSNRKLAQASLPQDLRNLKSSINPNALTPLLMLAFLDYYKKWEQKPDNQILESDRGPLNAILENMLNYAVRVLFSDELKATFRRKLNFTGLQIVREIFVLMCHSTWSEGTYHPLLKIGDRALREYEGALKQLPVRQKRGDSLLPESQKSKLARLFGIESNATFEGRAKSDYVDLMQYRDLGGDKAEVRLQLHPLEQTLMDAIGQGPITYKLDDREVPAVEAAGYLNMAHAAGYRDEEAQAALRLLVARDLVRLDQSQGLIYRLPAGPSASEVQRRLQGLKQRTDSLPKEIADSRDAERLLTQIHSVHSRFSAELDEEELEELSAEIRAVEEGLTAFVDSKLRQVSSQIASSLETIQKSAATLRQMSELDEEAPVGLDFRSHLMNFQEVLQRQRRTISSELSKLEQQFKTLDQRVSSGRADDLHSFFKSYAEAMAHLEDLGSQISKLEANRTGLVNWFKLLKDSDALFKSLGPWADLRRQLTEALVPEIRQNLTQRANRQELSELAGDAEVYRNKFDEIARERDNRIATGSEAFGEKKQQFRQWLASLGIERSDFVARYDPLDHDGAYQDLYRQVGQIAVAHLDHMAEQLGDVDRTLLHAKLIRYEKLTEEERIQLQELESHKGALQMELKNSRDWLHDLNLAETDDDVLKSHAVAIHKIGIDIDRIDQEARKLIGPPLQPQTPQEEKVMSLLGDRKDVVDLTELVLSAGNTLSLEELMNGLLGLYRGNQIILKIHRRG